MDKGGGGEHLPMKKYKHTPPISVAVGQDSEGFERVMQLKYNKQVVDQLILSFSLIMGN